MPELEELIEAADLNALLRAVDDLCAARDWDRLVDLAEMCEDALERGKQLWPIADHIDYRLALEAPGDYAAGVLGSDPSRFVLGPLTEVAASSHTWHALADYLESNVVAAYVAQECILRGEKLGGDDRAHPGVLELPVELLSFEPTYCLATYRKNTVEVAEPWDPVARMKRVHPRPETELDEPELSEALLELVTPWVTESNGAARVAVVEGDGLSAASTLSMDEFRFGPLTTEEALQRMAWAAASGGAHGRRRGAALGRFTALYTGALATDLAWPPDFDELAETLDELNFYRWDEEEAAGEGWVLRLAIEDPEQGWAAAISASDLLEEDDGSAQSSKE
ncbi:MAG: hypothetical protein ACRDK3_08800 [Actinomycetota bacterium]